MYWWCQYSNRINNHATLNKQKLNLVNDINECDTNINSCSKFKNVRNWLMRLLVFLQLLNYFGIEFSMLMLGPFERLNLLLIVSKFSINRKLSNKVDKYDFVFWILILSSNKKWSWFKLTSMFHWIKNRNREFLSQNFPNNSSLISRACTIVTWVQYTRLLDPHVIRDNLMLKCDFDLLTTLIAV